MLLFPLLSPSGRAVPDWKINDLLCQQVRALFATGDKPLNDPTLELKDLPLVSLPGDDGILF